GDYGHTNFRGDNCCLACLPGGSNLAAKKGLSVTLMIERLAVASDEFCFHSGLSLSSHHGVSIEFSQEKIQARQISYACACGIHCSQHGGANCLGIRIFGVPEQFECGRRSAADARMRYAHQCHVDAVR